MELRGSKNVKNYRFTFKKERFEYFGSIKLDFEVDCSIKSGTSSLE